MKTVITKVIKTIILRYKGSTLVTMHSNEEPRSIFGGMAVPQWDSPGKGIDGIDPAD